MEARLRPLTERDCYARLYGERNPLVTVLRGDDLKPSWSALSAERLRRAMLDRLEVLEAAERARQVDAEAA